MRITAGSHRGRRLAVPPGRDVRPTADRTRQALFNILEHGHFRPGGGSPVRDAIVLDAFAGTGALGLEALSRGAAHAVFMDNGRDALAALEKNIAACREQDRATVLRADATRPPPFPTARPLTLPSLPRGEGSGTASKNQTLSPQGRGSEAVRVAKKEALSPGGRGLGEGDPPGQPGRAVSIAFLDPPYGSGLAAPALTALAQAGWLADGAICVVELAAREDFTAPEGFEALDERRYGAARVVLLRHGDG